MRALIDDLKTSTVGCILKRLILVVALISSGLLILWMTADTDTRRLIANIPTDRDVLFWSTDQRDAAFRAMDWLPILAASHVIESGEKPYPLPRGEGLDMDIDIEAYMKEQRTAALVIVQDGKVRFEEYGLDFNADGHWTSFSVAKSFTSTLVGAAIKDGFIASIDDKVSHYLPDLKGSAYDDVSIEQLLTMTSGVQWNEDYEDKNSDVALFNEHRAEEGLDVTVSYMRSLPRDTPAGSQWVYKTGETNLIGVLVSAVTGKSLSQYLSEKIWGPFGMQQDGSWLLGSTGHEISGCCIQAATRDFARFGMFMLAGGIAGGNSVLPEDWIETATTRQADIGVAGKGYGYQWWTYDDGSYAAQGIFGQGIFIDPKRNLVIASNSNWPIASDSTGLGAQREGLYRMVQRAVDAESQ